MLRDKNLNSTGAKLPLTNPRVADGTPVAKRTP